MEVFPKKKIISRALLIAASCSAMSIPFLIRGKAVFLFMAVIWGCGLLFFAYFMRRYLKREKISQAGLASGIRNVLKEKVSFYNSLSRQDRESYENSIAIFLAEHTVTGVSGVQITDEVLALVAATAVRLTFRRPGWEYHNFGEILIYPSGFAADGSYSTKGGEGFTAAGLVHSQGGVILSLPHLLRSFEHANDGFNVGYHEFAHVLDGRSPDGVVAGFLQTMGRDNAGRVRKGSQPPFNSQGLRRNQPGGIFRLCR